MSIFRSYLNKSATLVFNNTLNTSQNPVTELVYGGESEMYSRFIFNIDLSNLINKINNDGLLENQVLSHKINFTNTIQARPDLIGSQFPSSITKRANSVTLQLFTVDQDWDEGTGFDIIYNTGLTVSNNYTPQAVNWYERKTNLNWTNNGVYVVTGSTTGGTLGVSGTTVLAEYDLELGNENLNIDITNYINAIIFSGATNYGIGIAYTPEFESLRTSIQLGINFYTNKTNTFFEPYLETKLDDSIHDDRRYFYQDKDNKLVLYTALGNTLSAATINSVSIYDYKNVLYQVITGDSINKIKNGVYYINLNIDSDQYPDSVNFRDVWSININGKNKLVDNKFYIIPYSNHYSFNINNTTYLSSDNYYINHTGISYGEKIKRGDKRRIKLNIKELYHNDLRVESLLTYRLYISQGESEIDIIPFESVNFIDNQLFIDIDTQWMVEYEYNLEFKIIADGVTYTKKNIIFFVV